jgi:hypothetical protein
MKGLDGHQALATPGTDRGQGPAGTALHPSDISEAHQSLPVLPSVVRDAERIAIEGIVGRSVKTVAARGQGAEARPGEAGGESAAPVMRYEEHATIGGATGCQQGAVGLQDHPRPDTG